MSGILVPKPMLGRQLPAGRARSLVGYWLFNEGSGNIVSDLSGNNNIGSFYLDTAWTTGKFGPATIFDGSGDRIDCGQKSSLRPTKAVTVAAWINLTSLGTGYNAAVAMRTSGIVAYQLWSALINKPSFTVRTGAGEVTATSGSNTPLNTWLHLVGTYDGANVRLYINGIENVVPSAQTGSIVYESNTTLYLGGYAGQASQTMTGRLDLPAVYNRALSASEIAELYLRPFIDFEREPLPLWTAATQGVEVEVGMAGAMTTNTGYWGW